MHVRSKTQLLEASFTRAASEFSPFYSKLSNYKVINLCLHQISLIRTLDWALLMMHATLHQNIMLR